ncbi:glycosyltransferase [Nostoc sp. CHAB 5834]|nr:glycosyltransferase [Nostoc sp. CHAB 5834]
MRVFVIVATVGRADLLPKTIAQLSLQTRLPDGIVICATSTEDVGDLGQNTDLPIEIIFAEKGLPRQRNAGLRHIAGRADIVVFFDDDFVPAYNYLEALEEVFNLRPNLVGATGKLIADGIKSAGISFEQGVSLVNAHSAPDIIQERALKALYGCNLCVRLAAAENIWFDETLPLYGWQEDVDFSYQLGRNGILIYTNLLTGVHLGIKGGRTSGKRLGYSQIANPVYLLHKKTIPRRLAWRLMSRNLAANLARSLYPEPYVDRVGRLQGNAVALIDLCTGRLHPQRILQL